MAETFSAQDLVRAWKDEQYRESLPIEVRERLPAAPEKLNELSDDQLAQAAGGFSIGAVPLMPINPIVGLGDPLPIR